MRALNHHFDAACRKFSVIPSGFSIFGLLALAQEFHVCGRVVGIQQ
jgi:hypothetical protein